MDVERIEGHLEDTLQAIEGQITQLKALAEHTNTSLYRILNSQGNYALLDLLQAKERILAHLLEIERWRRNDAACEQTEADAKARVDILLKSMEPLTSVVEKEPDAFLVWFDFDATHGRWAFVDEETAAFYAEYYPDTMIVMGVNAF